MSFGEEVKISLFGESHSYCVGMLIEGLKSGIYLDINYLEEKLKKRKTHDKLSTSRNEEDKIEFLSGVFNNYTDGSPLVFIIKNKDIKSEDYIKGNIRPSHADYTYYEKYHHYNDYRGGGYSSGRLTAPIIVLGAIIESILPNIKVTSRIYQIGDVFDDEEVDINSLEGLFATSNKEKSILMQKEIEKAKLDNDSLGGIVETFVQGVPIGLGEPFFDSLESMISHALFSIGGVKGVLFGDGIKFASSRGSEVNDQMSYIDGKVTYLTNHNGGINGGISNGQVISFKTIIKPTSSISKTMKTINVQDQSNIELNLKGRHDSCLVHRIKPVIDALTYYVIYEMMLRGKKWNTD